MKTLKLFDLHCDTPSELYRNGTSLDQNPHHVSLAGAEDFAEYTQVMAIYSNRVFDDESAFRNFHKTADYLMTQFELFCDRATFVRNAQGYGAADTSFKFFLAVEDARLLNGVRDRLRVLYARGVRFLTPVWGGESCIGGAHDTSLGLTEFGKQTVEDCFSLGIVPDISHASEQTAEDIFTIAQKHGKPVIATHSASHAVRSHTRNLRDNQFEAVKNSGGLVGVCLYRDHLCDRREAHISDIIAHIEHYLSLGGENTVTFGSDFDGAEMPVEIHHPSDLIQIADALARLNYSNEQIEKLFFKNADRFVSENL